jgi:hypothetical protein
MDDNMGSNLEANKSTMMPRGVKNYQKLEQEPRTWFRFEKSKNRVPKFRYSVFGTRFLPGYQEPGFSYYLIIFIY